MRFNDKYHTFLWSTNRFQIWFAKKNIFEYVKCMDFDSEGMVYLKFYITTKHRHTSVLTLRFRYTRWLWTVYFMLESSTIFLLGKKWVKIRWFHHNLVTRRRKMYVHIGETYTENFYYSSAYVGIAAMKKNMAGNAF